MKKLLVIAGVLVGVLALLLWIVSWFRTPEAVATSGAKPWPGGLGSLEVADKRYPARQASDGCVKLMKLAGALPQEEGPADQFVYREIARGDLMIGKPPALPDVSAMRELLLREPVVWERPAGVGVIGNAKTQTERGIQMRSARALVASALAKAHADDPAAWEDLRAAWNLARSLEGEPQMMTQTAALGIARMINAVAWKMPLPAPEWFGEVQQRDYVRPLLESFQAQATSYWKDGSRIFPTKWLADSVEKDRRIAEDLFNDTRCEVKTPMNDLGTDLSSFWRRAFRYRAEREATANALRVREEKPIETASRCGDGGKWTFDGTTLRFSREIDSGSQDRPMPLALRVRR